MDSLDLHSDFGNAHSISYELPRFCNVKSQDFDFLEGIDCNNSCPTGKEFGVLSVSASYSLHVLFFMHIQILFHCVFVFV